MRSCAPAVPIVWEEEVSTVTPTNPPPEDAGQGLVAH